MGKSASDHIRDRLNSLASNPKADVWELTQLVNLYALLVSQGL